MNDDGVLAAAIADAALPLYGLKAKPQLINISENATFRIDDEARGSFALRVHRPNYHSKLAIASELSWAIDLRKHGVVQSPIPIAGLNGELIQTAGADNEQRHVVLFKWLQGHEPQITDNLENSMQQLGAIAANMHAHAKQWQRPSWFRRHTWNFGTALGDDRPHWGRWRNAMGMTPEIEKIFARGVSAIHTQLKNYGASSEKFGLIHGDLRLANILVDDPNVKVIDFDDSGFSWFMYDAATPTSFHEHEPQANNIVAAWIEGYRTEAILSAEDEAIIETFILFRRILLTAWLGSHSTNKLAQGLGDEFTHQTGALIDHYLSKK